MAVNVLWSKVFRGDLSAADSEERMTVLLRAPVIGTPIAELMARAFAIAHHRSDQPEGGMSDLYDNDILIWSEHQAELLRRVASGEPVNEAPDWPNIIEEIESVGHEQLHAVTSLLVQALVHC